jgi:hypothetical protein
MIVPCGPASLAEPLRALWRRSLVVVDMLGSNLLPGLSDETPLMSLGVS